MGLSPLHHLKRRLSGLLIEGFFTAGSAAWRALPGSRPERNGVTRVADVPYRPGGDRAHLLDVYRPISDSAAPLPALLYIHGGSFRILSKESHFMMAQGFARAGYIVFNINYRLSPGHAFPAALEDVADAYRWVVEQGPRWGADVSQLVVAGESAGGNLALAVTVMSTYERPEPYARRVYQLGVVPRALVALCGILHVSDPARARGRAIPPFLRDRIEAAAEAYLGADTAPSPERAFADPLVLLEQKKPDRPFPPTFASVGTLDPLLDDTLRLGDRLRALDITSEAQVVTGQRHAFQALVFLPAVKRHWDDMLAFLRRALSR